MTKLEVLPLPIGRPMIRRGQPLRTFGRLVPLWFEKGWRRNGHGFTGYYRAGQHHWRGFIWEPYPGGYQAYIWDPPLRELDIHTSHRPCFRHPHPEGGKVRYEVHFNVAPSSLEHAIESIESVLQEAIKSRNSK